MAQILLGYRAYAPHLAPPPTISSDTSILISRGRFCNPSVSSKSVAIFASYYSYIPIYAVGMRDILRDMGIRLLQWADIEMACDVDPLVYRAVWEIGDIRSD